MGKAWLLGGRRGWRLAPGGWRLEAGGRRLETGADGLDPALNTIELEVFNSMEGPNPNKVD